MSSHHIVKEKQEPALLIADIEALEVELLGQLLEWTPTIIANDISANKLIELGLKVDIVVTHGAFSAQDNVTLIYNEQLSFIETALNFLIEQDYPAVNIISFNFDFYKLLPYLKAINIVIFKNGQKIIAIKSGFKKWAAINEVIEISSNTPIKTKGLKKLNQHQFKTNQDGVYEICFDDTYIFIAENL